MLLVAPDVAGATRSECSLGPNPAKRPPVARSGEDAGCGASGWTVVVTAVVPHAFGVGTTSGSGTATSFSSAAGFSGPGWCWGAVLGAADGVVVEVTARGAAGFFRNRSANPPVIGRAGAVLGTQAPVPLVDARPWPFSTGL